MIFYVTITDAALYQAIADHGYTVVTKSDEAFQHCLASDCRGPVTYLGTIEGLLGFQIYAPIEWCDWTTLTYSNCRQHWGWERMLLRKYGLYTYDSLLGDLDAIASWYADHTFEGPLGGSFVFVRPDSNDKSFPGGVIRTPNLAIWLKQTTTRLIDGHELCVVGTPRRIDYEYRIWIANQQIVTYSQYVGPDSCLEERLYCPTAGLDFAVATAKRWSPHPLFVLDIAQCGDQFKIVECGSFHTCGFYAADRTAIVRAMVENLRRS